MRYKLNELLLLLLFNSHTNRNTVWGAGGLADGPRSQTRHPALPHQKLPTLLPLGALGVGVSVGLGHQVDELPLRVRGLRPGLKRPYQLVLLTLLAVLLDQTPLGHAFTVVQHHWGGGREWWQSETTTKGIKKKRIEKRLTLKLAMKKKLQLKSASFKFSFYHFQLL